MQTLANHTLGSLSLAITGSIWTNLAVVFFLAVCVMMILVVLIQRPQGGGLSGAFGAGGGGSGAGQTAFGTKTGDVLTYTTIAVFVIYLLVAIVLNFATRPSTAGANPEPTLVTPGQPVETSDQSEGQNEAQNEGQSEGGDPAAEPAGEPSAPEPSSAPAGEPAAESPTEAPAPATTGDEPEIDPASAELPPG